VVRPGQTFDVDAQAIAEVFQQISDRRGTSGVAEFGQFVAEVLQAPANVQRFGHGITAGDRLGQLPVVAVEDDDNEIPGTLKSFDGRRRVLVVTLLNGKDRSFILPRDVKVVVQGSASKRGLGDPALKAGASIEVVTDEGGHKVTELKITPALAQRKKAS
jgi:hypothetical protein